MFSKQNFLSAIALIFAGTATMPAQQSDCGPHAERARGQVLDATGAVVVGAKVSVRGAANVGTDAEGRFSTACLAEGAHNATISAESFEPVSVALRVGEGSRAVLVRLKPSTVETEVTAAVDAAGVDSQDVAGSQTLQQSDVKQLADDPDEFARQLQVLAAAAGGAPGQATIAVDGFQNSGRIPPKSSIAFIRVNPDLFSAEYAQPPYRGGRVEIYTKPGQDKVHGALFTTQSGAWMNAKDPFATSRAAIGKQRYGFELSGPIQHNKSDFALALEHRQIDQFGVVNAVTLDSAGNPVSTIANVPTPQSLWEASARFGVMLSPKNNFTATYTAGVNGLSNVGVGGTMLQETGYSGEQSEHVIHVTNLQTISANVVHETRVGYTWRYRTDTPNSTAPSVQVAGSFSGGGVTTGFLRAHERDFELDDDILYSHGKHSVKAGIELLNTSLHDAMPTQFNGTYIFGGGTAPVLNGSVATGAQTTTTGLEQYRRALLGLPGGTPTQFDVATGTPQVSLNQLQTVLYAQDQWKFRPRLQFSLGLRWAMQNAPTTVGNVGPRVGVSWAPDRKQKTVFHARSGLFFGTVDPQTVLSNIQLNGVVQRQLQVNQPVYGSPFINGVSTGTSTITTLRAPLPNLTQQPSLESHLGVEHDFPKHWHAQANLYLVHAWDTLRSSNINAPVDGSATGARPIETNTNLFQFEQTAHLGGNVLFIGMDQHSLKRLQIFAGYVRMDLRGNSDGPTTFAQSSATNAGEVSRLSWEATHQIIAFANYAGPQKINFSMQFNAASGLPYNVTTGFDNNNDGVFNDRPFYTPAASSPTYATRFGVLAPQGTGGTIGRNAATLPWNVHLDANLSRSFDLPHAAGKEAQTLAVNLRSTNLLNHANITAASGVLGSPFFGQGYAADPGRRVEAGVRWSF